MSDKIPDGWKKYKLNEIATIKSGKSNSIDAVADGIYPLFDRSKNVKKSSKYLFDCEAIIVPGEGEDFTPKYYKGKFDLHQRAYAVIPDNQICDGKYCYYAILNGRSHFSSVAVGSTVKSLRLSSFESFDILIPPLPEQRAIASIFPPIEDKIELLRQENETLEAMAETIFRQWFIEEFDSLGQCTINDLCSKIATGGTPLTHVESYYNGNINWFTTKELNDNFLYDSEKKITEEGLKNSSAKLFPPGTVLIAIYAAPTVGKLGILKKEAAFNQATCGLVADESICCPEFLYFYLKSQRNNLISMATGSVQQNLKVSKIRSYPAFKATKEKIDKFQEIIQPFLDKIFFNKQQLQTLSQLFDTLLHGLMSGELRVDDALCQS